jgi:hypothetical protein
MLSEKLINAIKEQIRSTENVILKPSTIIPIATLEQLVLEYEYLQEQLKKCNKETIQKETVETCLQIIDNHAHYVTTQKDKQIGDGTQKNLALLEVHALIKKNFKSI